MFACMLLSITGCKTPIEFPRGDYPNGELLVSADFLETILDEPGVVIIDARADGYDTAHIPGAISLQWIDFVDDNMGLLAPAAIAAKLGEAGLNSTMTFVIYDDTLASWGAAGRIFWMLEYLGQPKQGQAIFAATKKVIAEKKTLTYDLGGNAKSSEMVDAIIKNL